MEIKKLGKLTIFISSMKMMVIMDRLVLCKKKIFYSVIRLYSIYVMNDFFLAKKPSNFFLHYQAVLKNISAISGKWVSGLVYFNIAIFIHFLSPFPIAIFSSQSLAGIVTQFSFNKGRMFPTKKRVSIMLEPFLSKRHCFKPSNRILQCQ